MISHAQNGYSRQSLFIDAMNKLKEAALLMIIGNIILSIGGVSLFPMMMAGMHGVSIGIVPGILVIVGLIVILIALYLHVVPSFEILRDYKPSAYGTASTLVRIGYIWGAILLIVGVLTLLIIIGVALIIIGFILLILGRIGLIVGMFNINNETNESMFLVTAILFIIGLFVPFLDFIGWILVYIGTDTAVTKYREKHGYMEASGPKETSGTGYI